MAVQEYDIIAGLERARKATQTPKPKPKNQHPLFQQLRIDDGELTVNRREKHGLGLWGNKRIVAGFRVDEKLYSEFKKASQAQFGSTCNPIEAFMAGVVGAYKTQQMNAVNRSPTISIGEIKIERNLRERRKLVKTHTETDTVEIETETTETLTKCVYCGAPASDSAEYLPTGQVHPLCSQHVVNVVYQNRDKWKVRGALK